MKTQHHLFTLLLLLIGSFIQAQTGNHPTIDTVKVMYKAPTQGTVNSGMQLGFTAVPQSTISLKTTTNVSKVHFKITGVSTNTVYYQVNYSLNSAPVYNNQNVKLFEFNNGNVFISSGQALPISPYTIKVQTEDTLQNLGPVFSIVQ